MKYWKTITTYLIDWNPSWIKTVELSNWVWKAIIIPRAKLKDAKQRNELFQPAIYFLFWSDDEWKNLSYIWEAENLINRISNHDTNKDFWDIVIAFFSKDNNLTKADVKYLEAKSIEKARKINRYTLLNWVEPIPNNLPEYQISTMNEFLDNIDLLISSIWYPIIKEINKNSDEFKKEFLYYCKWPSANASWAYWSDWFLVLKNSIVRKKLSKTAWSWIQWIQDRLINEKIIIDYNSESYIFNEDYLFKSPSASSWLILWRRANWWKEWKNNEWKTLDEIERKTLT